jgi:hypothetical protein
MKLLMNDNRGQKPAPTYCGKALLGSTNPHLSLPLQRGRDKERGIDI